jgi:hypothetical protein
MAKEKYLTLPASDARDWTATRAWARALAAKLVPALHETEAPLSNPTRLTVLTFGTLAARHERPAPGVWDKRMQGG